MSLGGLITYLLLLLNRIKNIKIFNFAFLAIIFLFIYIIFLILSISLIDIATPLDDRILFPILILLIPIFCISIQHKTTRYSFISKLLLSMFLLFSIIKNSIDSLNWVRFNYYNGAGLASKDLRDRALNNYLLSCSSNLIIASNSPWDFELILDRKVHWLPRPSDMTSGKINRFFNEQIANLKNKYDIIVLTNTDIGFYNDIGPSNGYELTYSGNDGTIWIREELPRGSCGQK